MKKILFLSPLPPPHYGSAMSSQMCLSILKENNQFEVKNIKLNYSEKIKDIGKINFSKIKGLIKVSQKIKKELKEFNPDLIYFVPATSGLGLIRDGHFSRLIKRHFSGKIIYHIRSRIQDNSWNNLFFRNIYKKMFKREKAIVLDKRLKSDLHKLILDKHMFILPNAIKNELSDKKANNLIAKRKKANSFNLLFLSNMDKTKGWTKVLDACRILKNKKINFQCNFVGEWKNKKDERYFEDFAIKNNLQKQVFALGKKTGKDKEKILENSDVLIFPTEYPLETFGRVIIEAMMFGLPVIANGIASIPTTIQNNKTGFILKENSPREIVTCLEKLQDKNFREKMGKQGRKRFLEKYEMKKYKGRFLKIIQNC